MCHDKQDAVSVLTARHRCERCEMFLCFSCKTNLVASWKDIFTELNATSWINCYISELDILPKHFLDTNVFWFQGMFLTGIEWFKQTSCCSNVECTHTSSWSWFSWSLSRPHRSGSHLTAISLSISSTSTASSAHRCRHRSTRAENSECWETSTK